MRTSTLFPLALLSIAPLSTTLAQTGIAVPGMTSCDAEVQAILDDFGVNGAVFALSRQGKLVYDRGFGHADLAGNEPTMPYHLFRLASVSKPITSVAIMMLREAGQLQLSDHVFGPGGILATHPYIGSVIYTDTRLNDITINQLLHHTEGWDRDISCFPNPTPPYPWFMGGCDPIGAPLYVTNELGESNPVSKFALVRFLMEHGLDHDPGTTFAYSNIGYLVLGLVIEQITGMDYDDYVQSAVFDQLGICDMHLGHNLLADKLEREVEYEGEGFNVLSCYGTGANVPWEYGGWNLEAMDAHGGWVGSARELVKLLVAVDGFSTKPDILSASTINTMVTPSVADPEYACGWNVNTSNNWWHTGALDGTATMIARSFNGYTWAILLNKRLTDSQATAFWTAIDALGWNCIGSTSSWPTYDLLAMPEQNASGVSVTPTGPTSIDISCTAGDGDGRLIAVRASSGAKAFPLDGTDYTASAAFGSGNDLGGANYVVSTGSGTSVSVNGLAPGTDYTVSVYEYTHNTNTGQYSLYTLCDRTDAQATTPVGIAENAANAQAFHAYMQGDHLMVQVGNAGSDAGLLVMDATGRTIMERAVPAPGLVDLGRSAAGLYIVSLMRNSVPVAAQRVSVVR